LDTKTSVKKKEFRVSCLKKKCIIVIIVIIITTAKREERERVNKKES